MPKEKLCDCGKPISQCQCKGHNHKQTKNVKKGGVPDYLSIFGDRVQQYADYKRKKQEQYTPRSLYDPFGIVVDIGDDGGLVGNASFYKPGRSRGTSMTKKEKIQMCEDCGKPEFACKCKGHQGGRSMSKSMCKCGSGMSKAMCKCSMGKRSTLSKAMCKCGSGMSKAMCKCGGMGKSMQKRRMPFPPPPPSPFGDGIKGTIMTFSGKMPGKMKDMLGLDNMFDVFKDSPMKLFGRMGKRNSLNKANDLPNDLPTLPLPRNPPYKGNVSSASDYVNYIYGDRPDPERPYGYYVGGPNERERNNERFNVNQMAELAGLMATPTPMAELAGLMATPTPTSSNSSQRIKQDARIPEYITNRVNAPIDSPRGKTFEAINQTMRPFPHNAEMYTMADEFLNQLDRYRRFITANTYNNTTGKPRSQVTPKYVWNQVLGPQYDYDNTTGKPRSQVTPDYVLNQVLGPQYDYDNTTGKPRSQVTPDYIYEQYPGYVERRRQKNENDTIINALSSLLNENMPTTTPSKRSAMNESMYDIRSMPTTTPSKRSAMNESSMYDIRSTPTTTPQKMGKRGKKVSKVWPLPDSDFERNGGKIGSQRPRGGGVYAPFGYEAMEGYNPAENAVRQMMPTPADIAYYDRSTKEKALANAFGDLLGAYGNELGSMFGNEDWWVRTAGRADRAANNTANSIASMFPPDNPGVPRGMMKRLSKSMKMDADMAKQPQKITPKRTIRHTDKYFK